MSSKMASGFSGQTWGILKWAWPHVSEHVATLTNACLPIRHHPTGWCHALVVVIPKLRRDDYVTAKNYHLISLLECLAKLLEKVVSKHMLYNIDPFNLIPTMQFSTWTFSCTLDAGLSLMHDIQVAHQVGFTVQPSCLTSRASSMMCTRTAWWLHCTTLASQPRSVTGPCPSFPTERFSCHSMGRSPWKVTNWWV